MDKIFWNFATFQKKLDSLQVKWWLISSVTFNKDYDWTPVKYLNVLHHNRTQNQL